MRRRWSLQAHVWRCLLVLLMAGLSVKSAWAYTVTVDEAPLAWSAEADSQRCPNAPSYLWVDGDAGPACIRYFAAGQLEKAEVLIVQFYGDRDKSLRQAPEAIENNTLLAQQVHAEKQAAMSGRPWVVMARPGTYGSSGDHRQRRYKEEYVVLGQALDELKRRYGVKKLVLLGHSGGATVIASLLTMGRDDIQCAVMSSGTYNYMARNILWRMKRHRSLDFNAVSQRIFDRYDPVFHVQGVVPDETRQLYIVGDPRDTNTPFHLQVQFAWMLRGYGHHVDVVEMEGKAPSYHNLLGSGLRQLAARCAGN